jgi:hypothetical protein
LKVENTSNTTHNIKLINELAKQPGNKFPGYLWGTSPYNY